MADECGEKKKVKSVGISTYARVRCFFKDRESLRRAVVAKSKKEAGGAKGTLTTLASEEESVRAMTTQFTDVIGENGNNEQTFKTICSPLIAKVLEGFKAILIAYGQTGSGKTFSLIGAKGPGQLGLLPRTCQQLLESENVIKIKLKAFEAYSTSLTKIILFDLYEDINEFSFEPFVAKSSNRDENKAAEYKWVQRKSQAAQALWNAKDGRTGVNTLNEGSVRDIDSIEDAFKLIEEAHDASHFAKTGKNPESSRGHTVYIVLVQMKNPKGADYSPIKTEFVVVDLAGSEGGSTLEKLPDGMEKTVRFLEGGVINYGLTSLKDMFQEMRRKGKLKKSEGNGLRKLLYPFMTTNTMMSIIFTLSPSWDNVMPTRATMKFAQDACKLKMKPVPDTGSKDWHKLYDKLKESLAKKDEIIEDLQEQLQQAIEHHSTQVEEGGGQMEEILTHIYQEQQDRVFGLFKDYGLTQFVDHAVVEDVLKDIDSTKKNYYGMLKKVFASKAPDRVEDIDDMMEDWITRGISIRAGYEFVCEQYDVVPQKLEPRRVTRGLIGPGVNKAAQMEQRRKTAMWVESAAILQTNLSLKMNDMDEELKDHEEEFFAIKVTGVEDGHGHLAVSPAGTPADFDHFGEDHHSHVEFEDIDLSKAPEWFVNLDEDTQKRVEHLFEDENNVDKGKLKYSFQKKMTRELNITRNQLGQLKDYFMIKKGQAHAHKMIKDFHADVGGSVGHEEMSIVIELQQKLHELENKMRIEKSLKLWGQMRLKMRDRKLKEQDENVKQMESRLTQQSSEISLLHKDIANIHKKDHDLLAQISSEIQSPNTRASMASPKMEAQLDKIDSIMTLVGMGGAGAGGGAMMNEKLEQDLAEANAKISTQEDQIAQLEKIKKAITDENMQLLVSDMAMLQQKYSDQKIKSHRWEGRVMEIRNVLNEQARKIESLTQQIFIILQFPKVITVSGRDGFNDHMNGHYHVGSHLHCGRVFYKHQDNLWALRWHSPKGLWIFDHRGLHHDDIGSACAECDVQHPLLVKKQWIVFGGEDKGFHIDPAVKITGSLEVPDDHVVQPSKRQPSKKIQVLKKR